MIVAFRVDASLQIGTGHVMRCLTLADALRAAGARCHFICREHPGHLVDLIRSRGFAVSPLPAGAPAHSPASATGECAAWLGADWPVDAAQTVEALSGQLVDWLVVDHYAIDARWEQQLRPSCRRLMVIDDLADRTHDCDLLLDQNLYRSMETRYDRLLAVSCRRLLGPKYALLRPEFAAARNSLRHRDGAIRRVLVFFGGADVTNETEKTLHALVQCGLPLTRVDVVVGAANPHRARIQELCAAHGGFHCHGMIDNMAQLLDAADLAIGAGGATTWERCAIGVPSLVTVVAENQLELTEHGAGQGLLFYLGTAAEVTVARISDALRLFAASPANTLSFAERGLATVDARGAQRVAGQLCPPPVVLRRATVADCDAMYQWRNAEETRRYIFDDKPIALETHRRWFHATLDNPQRVLLVGEIEDRPVGVVRYDFTGDTALISVYLVPGGQGRGVGSELIRRGSLWVKEHYPQVSCINAEIFKENVASLRAFESAGYREHHSIYQERL